MTTTLPDNVPSILYGSDAGPDQWYYIGQSLYHNRKQTKFPDLPSLNELRTQQRVGIQITENGELIKQYLELWMCITTVLRSNLRF